VDNVDRLTGIFGCEVFSLPLKYLGLPLVVVIRPSVFRMVLLKRLSGGWLVGSGCIS
jgi:hypothetical protein